MPGRGRRNQKNDETRGPTEAEHFPHTVLLLKPSFGFERRLIEMHEWCVAHAGRRYVAQQVAETVKFLFADAGIAERFAKKFGGQLHSAAR